MSIDTIFSRFLATTDGRATYSPAPATVEDFLYIMCGAIYEDEWPATFFTSDERAITTREFEPAYPIEDYSRR